MSNQSTVGMAHIIASSAVAALLLASILSHLADVTEPSSSNRFADVWVMAVDAGGIVVLAIPVGAATVGMWIVYRWLGLNSGSSFGTR